MPQMVRYHNRLVDFPVKEGRAGSSPVQTAMALKKFGRKMANPRITRSKENRSCGPLGRLQKLRFHQEDPKKFPSPTMKPWTLGTSKIAPSMVIHRKQRLQRTRKEVFDYFELKDTQVA